MRSSCSSTGSSGQSCVRAAAPPRQPVVVRASSSESRRRHLLQLAGVGASVLLPQWPLRPARADEELVRYEPARDKTPALRAGTIKPEDVYSFSIPPGMKEARIAGAQTGNFCQPRCAEPWTEASFEGKEGKVVLLAVPLVKLTNAKNVSPKDLGTADQLIQRFGSYITGADFDPDAVISTGFQRRDDNLDYAVYELYDLNAMTGPRLLTAFATKGEVAYLFIVSATERQWNSSEPVLRKVLDSFRA